MRIRSYYSGTVESALDLARRELGSDALLLESRPAAADVRHLGAYEVVFGLDEMDTPADFGEVDLEPAPESLVAFLTGRGMLPSLARKLDARIGSELASESDVRSALAELVTVEDPRTRWPRAVALVGQAGTGKSSMVMRLALERQARNEAVSIVCLDARIGASEPLRRMAAVAGIPFMAPHPADGGLKDVASQMERARGAFWLVDTPPLALSDTSAVRSLGAALHAIPGLEVWLTVMATSQAADLLLAAERLQALSPARLVFTRMDEATSGGGLVSLMAQTGLAATWTSSGLEIPGGLEVANLDRILDLVFRSPSALSRLAAAG